MPPTPLLVDTHCMQEQTRRNESLPKVGKGSRFCTHLRSGTNFISLLHREPSCGIPGSFHTMIFGSFRSLLFLFLLSLSIYQSSFPRRARAFSQLAHFQAKSR